MHIINPTVTWPNHTTMVTGVRADEHGLLVNGSLVPTGTWPPIKVDPMVDKVKMVHVPTVYDAAHKAGLTTAQIDWVAINNAPTITWPFNEWATPEGRGGAGDDPQRRDHGGRRRPISPRRISCSATRSGPRRRTFLIREHKPNLMLLHFLSLDSMHHQFGPKSLAANSAMAFLDSCVEKVVAAVREAGMQDRTTFLIVADHGFKGYTKEIHPAVALAAAGLTGKAHVIPEGGTAMIYVDQIQAADPASGEGAARASRGSGRSWARMGLPRWDFRRRTKIRR